LYYESELKALKKAYRFRSREVFKESLVDFASNDYLGLSKREEGLKEAFEVLKSSPYFSPKASMLVNGYSQIHKNFEEDLAFYNSFEGGLIVGSGYLANLSLIDALIRKKDTLFIDEEFHASGIMATKMLDSKNVVTFLHNNPEDLRAKLKRNNSRNRVIFVEGIYSMSGDLLKKEFFDIAEEEGAILVVDEAHSSGVLGDNLIGIFEFYGVKIAQNHIKMGTLGKAYGSYGAYILSSNKIISFLLNRAKPIIYSTALSLFDTALAHSNFKYILRESNSLNQKLNLRRKNIESFFKQRVKSLILTINFEKDETLLQAKDNLIKKGFLVGAIRRPTVSKPILRVIPNIGVNDEVFKKFVEISQELGFI